MQTQGFPLPFPHCRLTAVPVIISSRGTTQDIVQEHCETAQDGHRCSLELH